MRYSLRNKNKIEAAYPGMLIRVIVSLTAYFTQHKKLEDCEVIGDDKYRTLIISDTSHSVNMITFYVISHKFDVYKLAFKEFIL